MAATEVVTAMWGVGGNEKQNSATDEISLPIRSIFDIVDAALQVKSIIYGFLT